MVISNIIQNQKKTLCITNNTLLGDDYIEKKLREICFLPQSEIEIVIDATETIVHRYSIFLEGEVVKIRGSAKSIEVAIEKFVEICNDGELGKLAEQAIEGCIERPKMYTKDELFTVLQRVYDDKDHTIIGRQVQGAKDHCISFYENQFKDIMGTYPGILGIDLACYGIDVQNKNELQISKFICDIVDYCGNGGILTVSSHMDNPSGNTLGGDRCRGLLGYDNSLEGYEKAFRELITEGTDLNKRFKRELEIEGNFLKLLMENNIPLVFRPLHEFNGSWFWFCAIQNGYKIDPSLVTDVWKYIYVLYTKEMGLSNLIWNYSPNVCSNPYGQWCLDTMQLYPGDEWCDMVGVDWYTSGKLEIVKGDECNYDFLIKKSGKIGAMNEFGASYFDLPREEHIYKYNSIDTYRDLLKLKEMGLSFAYLLAWFGFDRLGYGAELINSGICLGRDDVKALFEEIWCGKE